MKASIIVVRVKDWVDFGKPLPPWATSKDVCVFCGEAVIVTPEYRIVIEKLGFEIEYICTHCFEEHAAPSSSEVN